MRVMNVLGGMAVAAALMAAPAMVGGSHMVEARAAPTQSQPTQQAPAPENKAVREAKAEQSGRRVRYFRGVPAAIKNRRGGELAHRQWRKVRSAGRHAA